MADLEVHSERMDDVPLLVALQQQMGLPDVLNAVIEPHGNRAGLSVGQLTTFWLAYMLSEGDHRMSTVEAWAAERLETLAALSPEPVRALDFTDDRLADLLQALSRDADWAPIEARLGERLIRVYALPTAVARLDSTSVVVHHESTAGGLFQYGHSKDHRPDLPQFKVMLASLDPLGLPLATLPVAGNRADDPLYLPAIQAAAPILGVGGHLYIGDAKMGALATRAYLQAQGDWYLVPLPDAPAGPESWEALLPPVWTGQQRLTCIREPDLPPPAAAPGRPHRARVQALAFETTRPQTAVVRDQSLTWDERVLVVYSPVRAREARRHLAERLARAEREVTALTPPRQRGQRQWTDQEALVAASARLLQRHRVTGLLTVSIQEEATHRVVRGYRGGAPRVVSTVRYLVQVTRDAAAIRAARRCLGWRRYAATAPTDRLDLSHAIAAYRQAPRIEHDFARLKGRPLGLRPLYVQREDHVIGLVRVLSLALRVLTLLEYVVREHLRTAQAALAELYPGNPTRRTTRPTTERLCQAFRGITLTIIQLPGQTLRHVTPLTELQRRILDLLGLPTAIYGPPPPVANSIPP